MSARALLRNLENVFLQGQLGTVDGQVKETYGLRAPIFGSRRFREAWREGGSVAEGLNPAFAQALAAANDLPVATAPTP